MGCSTKKLADNLTPFVKSENQVLDIGKEVFSYRDSRSREEGREVFSYRDSRSREEGREDVSCAQQNLKKRPTLYYNFVNRGLRKIRRAYLEYKNRDNSFFAVVALIMHLCSYLFDFESSLKKSHPPEHSGKQICQSEDYIDYINKQSMLFKQHKRELIRKYKGKYVLFENGEVIDTDVQRESLADRAFNQHGKNLVFITKVDDNEPNESINIWTPFNL